MSDFWIGFFTVIAIVVWVALLWFFVSLLNTHFILAIVLMVLWLATSAGVLSEFR